MDPMTLMCRKLQEKEEALQALRNQLQESRFQNRALLKDNQKLRLKLMQLENGGGDPIVQKEPSSRPEVKPEVEMKGACESNPPVKPQETAGINPAKNVSRQRP